MIAVVDDQVECPVVIGSAASPRLAGSLVHGDLLAALHEADGGCKAGQPGTNDVNHVGHQTKA